MTTNGADRRRAAVTGSTGFIGAALVRALAGRGYRVKALARREQAPYENIEWIYGALNDPEALQELVAETDLVVHCAGLVKARNAAEFDEVNAAGVARLADAVKTIFSSESGPRFVHVSSLAAREPTISPYARSKSQGEIELHERRELDWVILRPPAVYGPGDTEILKLLKLMAVGFALVPGDLSARFSLLHVDDVISAVEAVAMADQVRHQTFELHDGTDEGWTLADVAEMAGDALEDRVTPMVVPSWAMHGAAAANQLLGRIRGRAVMLSPGKARELLHPDWVARENLLNNSGLWSPAVPAREGLRRTIAELKSKSLI